MDKEIEPRTPKIKESIWADCVEQADEVISESFICCVCLDLLYKPIVLACGHVSCFWCIYKSMNWLGGSRCPVCRQSYHHFPTICEMLHFLIVKMYPNAYHRRDKQMLEQEETTYRFSPKLEISSLKSISIGKSAYSSIASSQLNLAAEVSKLDINCSVRVTKENSHSSGTLNQISITDVLCPTCKKLLFRPTVLNCGHVLCETCITVPEDEIIICSVCECPHQSDLPKVCLELNNFLEIAFHENYMARNDSIERRRIDLPWKHLVDSSCKTYPTENLSDWLHEPGSKVHIGFLCDYCGVYPIVGTRYRCKDCKETMGFDLCEICYNAQSILPGRFDQKHTKEHGFEVMETAEIARQRMLGETYNHGLDLSADASEESLIQPNIMDLVDSQENVDYNEDGSAELALFFEIMDRMDHIVVDSQENTDNDEGFSAELELLFELGDIMDHNVVDSQENTDHGEDFSAELEFLFELGDRMDHNVVGSQENTASNEDFSA